MLPFCAGFRCRSAAEDGGLSHAGRTADADAGANVGADSGAADAADAAAGAEAVAAVEADEWTAPDAPCIAATLTA